MAREITSEFYSLFIKYLVFLNKANFTGTAHCNLAWNHQQELIQGLSKLPCVDIVKVLARDLT